MDTEKYKALITAVETGSLAAAAAKLGYTTSGISRMMAALENETGLPLLIRSKTGVQPTAACTALLPAMRQFLASADILSEKSAAFHQTPAGTIRIGTAYSCLYSYLARTLQLFSSTYPDVSIEIISGYSTPLAENCRIMNLISVSSVTEKSRPGGFPLAKMK